MIFTLRPWIAALTASLILLVSACTSGSDDATLTLRAESSSGEADVSYQIGSGDFVTETVSTPWEQTIDVSGAFGVDLTVVNLGESGTVACGIERTTSRLSNPSATGEASADCNVSGTSRAGKFTMSFESFGTPFEEEPAVPETNTATPPEVDAADIPDGMSAELLVTDRNGYAIEASQFNRVWISIVVEGALGADEVQVLVEGEIDDGVSVLTVNSQERYEADDIESTGRLVHVLRSIDLDQPGTLRAEFAGDVKVDDISLPVDDRVVVDIAPTVVETRELSDGFVTLDVASVARTIEDVPARRSVDSSESRPVTIGDLRGISAVDLGASDVSFFQVESSSATTVGEVADVVEELFAESGDVERVVAEIDGREAVRIEFEASRSGTADVLLVDGEILFVQTRWSDTGASARDARDSIRFDPSQLAPPG
jgi:hypothetical protein